MKEEKIKVLALLPMELPKESCTVGVSYHVTGTIQSIFRIHFGAKGD